jgi:hypothetical protein
LTNQEIGAQLFISMHTVEWHLLAKAHEMSTFRHYRSRQSSPRRALPDPTTEAQMMRRPPLLAHRRRASDAGRVGVCPRR